MIYGSPVDVEQPAQTKIGNNLIDFNRTFISF